MGTVQRDGREDSGGVMSFVQLPKEGHFVHQPVVCEAKEIVEDKSDDCKGKDVEC